MYNTNIGITNDGIIYIEAVMWRRLKRCIFPPPSSVMGCSNFLGKAATISARPATRKAWLKERRGTGICFG